MSTIRVIVPSRRARISALACGFVTALFIAGSVGFLLEPLLSDADRFTASALCAFVALGVGALAWRMGQARGGLFLDEARDAIGLGMTGPGDIWWLDRVSCLGIHVSEPDEDSPSDSGLYGVVLVRASAPPVILVETPDPLLTEEAATSLESGLGLGRLDVCPAWDEGRKAVEATAWVRVARRVALHGLMTAMGIASLGVGGILVASVASHPIVAIFIAPVAILTGMVLLTIIVVKRLATEELRRHEGRWLYRWRLYGFAWGERSLSAEDSSWRLRVGDGGGARLELITREGEVWLGSGATARSQDSVEQLARFPDRFLSQPVDQSSS